MRKIDPSLYFESNDWLVLDTEATGLKIHLGCKPFMVCAIDHAERKWCWSTTVDPITREPQWKQSQLDEIQLIIDQYSLLIFHHAKFDKRMLATLGIKTNKPHWDTSTAAHIRSSSEPLGLKEQCERHLGISTDDEEALLKAVRKCGYYGRRNNWNIGKGNVGANYWLPEAVARHSKLPKNHEYWNLCEKYCGKDVWRTALLYLLQRKHPRVVESSRVLIREFRVSELFMRMEEYGTTVSMKRLKEMYPVIKDKLDTVERTCKDVVGDDDFNIRSNPQLNQLLFGNWELQGIKRTKTGWSTDAKTIKALLERQLVLPEEERRKDIVRFLSALQEYGKGKQAASYLASYIREYHHGILYGFINQHGASTTTRTSFSDPNKQNIPKGKEQEDGTVDFMLRYVFGPKKGRIWYDFDFDQLQLRIFAYAAQDQSLIDAFDQGWDFHNFVASRLFGIDEPSKLQRRIAKNVNFALIFGAGPSKVDATAGQPGTYDKYRKQFPCIDKYMTSVISHVRKYGWVKTLDGYYLDVPPEYAYAGVNYIVQGTEGTIAKQAVLETDIVCRDNPKYDCHLTNFIHDELLFDSILTPKLPLGFLRKLLIGMETAGRKCGVKVVANCEVNRKTWDVAEKISL